jgi:omega-amidase
MYVAACSPARDDSADYKAWGHSTIVDPKGIVLATCEESETIIYADIGKSGNQSVRELYNVY